MLINMEASYWERKDYCFNILLVTLKDSQTDSITCYIKYKAQSQKRQSHTWVFIVSINVWRIFYPPPEWFKTPRKLTTQHKKTSQK